MYYNFVSLAHRTRMGVEFCEVQLTSEQTNWTSLSALASSVVSLFGASYMLLSYFLFSTRKNPLSKLVAWLAFADWLVAINNIVKLVIVSVDSSSYSWPLCVFFRVYFQLSSGE